MSLLGRSDLQVIISLVTAVILPGTFYNQPQVFGVGVGQNEN